MVALVDSTVESPAAFGLPLHSMLHDLAVGHEEKRNATMKLLTVMSLVVQDRD